MNAKMVRWWWWIGLCALTLGLFELGSRWEPVGENLLADSDSALASPFWRVHSAKPSPALAEGSELQLDVDAQVPQSLALQRVQVVDDQRYQLSGELRLTQHAGGPGARAVIVSVNPRGESMFARDFSVHEVEHDQDWKPFSSTLLVWPDVERVDVGVDLAGQSGRLLVRDLELHQVRESQSFARARAGLLLVWILSLGALLRRLPELFNRERASNRIVGAARVALCGSLFAIFLGACVPAPFVRSAGLALHSFLEGADSGPAPRRELPVTSELGPVAVKDVSFSGSGLLPHTSERVGATLLQPRKLGHLFGFLALSASCLLSFGYGPLRALALSVFAAISTELLQNFSAGRSPSLFDFWVDLAGGLLGIVLILALSKKR